MQHRIAAFFAEERNVNAFLLLGLLTHNLFYPLSTGGGIQPVIYYIPFSAVFAVVVYLLSHRRSYYVLAGIATPLFFVSGLYNAYAPSPYTQLALYLSAIVLHIVMILALLEYIFLQREQVLLEVILAATSLYLVYGSVFTAIYGLIELLQPGSFVVSSGEAVTWQHLFYYSYVTLTTVGYGDITPRLFYAQSFSVFEAVIGQLYTVILLSRLVSMYNSNSAKSSDNPQSNQAA